MIAKTVRMGCCNDRPATLLKAAVLHRLSLWYTTVESLPVVAAPAKDLMASAVVGEMDLLGIAAAFEAADIAEQKTVVKVPFEIFADFESCSLGRVAAGRVVAGSGTDSKSLQARRSELAEAKMLGVKVELLTAVVPRPASPMGCSKPSSQAVASSQS